ADPHPRGDFHVVVRAVRDRAGVRAALQPQSPRGAEPVLQTGRTRTATAVIGSGGDSDAGRGTEENRARASRRSALGGGRVPSPALGILLQLPALAAG